MSRLDVCLEWLYQIVEPEKIIHKFPNKNYFAAKNMHRITVHLLNISSNLKEWDEVPPSSILFGLSTHQAVILWSSSTNAKKRTFMETDG